MTEPVKPAQPPVGATPPGSDPAIIPIPAAGQPPTPEANAAAAAARIKADEEARKQSPKEDARAAIATRTDEAANVLGKPEVQNAGVSFGGFSISGKGFGAAPGHVTIGGRSVTVTRWNDTSIKGNVPGDIAGGEVRVTTVNGVEVKGSTK